MGHQTNNPEFSLEQRTGLKLYTGHIMRRLKSVEKSVMLGMVERKEDGLNYM